MSASRVIVQTPATTANLGPGFDVFGLALKEPKDKVTIVPASKGIRIEVSGLAANTIPINPELNTAGVVANRMFTEFSLEKGVMIKIEKGILPSIGLGSSAASAAAVAYGLNSMYNLKLSNEQLIQLAAKGEVVSAGFEHADNVSAAIYGGFVIIKSYNPLEIVHLNPPPNMRICIAIPKVPNLPRKTEKARALLPKFVSMENLVHNVGNAASIASGFATGDVDLIGRSMSDSVVEPARALSIPGYQSVKQNALKFGACGVAISGAGPAMIALVNSEKNDVYRVAKAMEAGFKTASVNATSFITKPGRGALLLELS